MDPIQFPENLASLSIEQLQQLATDARAQLQATFAVANPTPTHAAEAERLFAGIKSVDEQIAAHQGAPDRLAAVRTAFETAPVEAPAPVADPPAATPAPVAAAAEAVEETEAETEETTEAAPAAAPATEAAVAPSAELAVDALNGQRPATAVTTATDRRPTILAAADVPGFGVGSNLTSLELSEALLDKFDSFPTPAGKSERFGTDLRTFGLASIRRDIPEELTITDAMSYEQAMAVLDRAADEKFLPQQSLVAAGGWCAPSPIDYGLGDDGSGTDLLWDAPTVALGRGGIKFTLGPDFADIYALSNFFKMTEAQAIAGSVTKPCFTVACPTFDDHRLDAYGYCFQIPFLTEAAYPEIIRRYLSGSMTAYAHKMDIEKITQLLALLPAAEVAGAWDVGSTSLGLGDALGLIIDRERTKRRLNPNSPVQVDVPMWVKNAIKSDIAKRNGRATASVTDAEVNAIFTQYNASVRWLYNFQPLGPTAVVYPSTFDMLIYPAGTFVVGTTNVVNLSSVYDAASIKSNIYTGAFFEEGMNLMRRGFGGVRITVPVCNSGKTGAPNIDLCPAP